jgi:hypothetical protein
VIRPQLHEGAKSCEIANLIAVSSLISIGEDGRSAGTSPVLTLFSLAGQGHHHGRESSMILLYSLALLLLGGVKYLFARRAGALARKYTKASAAVDQLLREGGYYYREGNTNRVEICKLAKRTYQLGLATQKRDRLEAKHFFWQLWSDRLGRWMQNLREWKGKKLPYTLGAVDVWLLLYLIDHFGMGEYVSARSMVEWMMSWLA